jgi:Tripartite tricarboxylate transporter TctB family
MKETLKRLDVWCKMALMALFVLLYLMARSYPAESRQFPQLIAVFTLAILLISLIRDFSGKTAASPGSAEASDAGFQAADQGNEEKERRRRFYLTWGLIIVSTALGFWGGFLITTFLLFIGFALFFGEKKHLVRNIVSAVAVTAVIYFVFEWIMRVPLVGN